VWESIQDENVAMTLRPAEPNTGIVFRRIDIAGAPSVKADVDNVIETTRSTTIEANGASVSTIEHLMAALVGNKVDNAVIEINSSEVPILDGSSEPFVEIIQQAGIQKAGS
jgi:UDP-3-O-[3-hydroxymyristoyl] N-acetylglucosamine deacetylase/3-hydroxyacyl-[acyl-carrier-protein] dehydratase